MKGKEQREGRGTEADPQGPHHRPPENQCDQHMLPWGGWAGEGALQRRLGRGEPHVFQHVHLQVSLHSCASGGRRVPCLHLGQGGKRPVLEEGGERKQLLDSRRC